MIHGALPGIERRADWARLVGGLFLVFGLFHVSATLLGSDRGQRGILVGLLVVTATAAATRFLLRRSQPSLVQQLGLGWPRTKGLVVAGGVASLLVTTGLVVLWARRLTPSLHTGWVLLLPGLFCQAGVAEEVLFRAYLFGQVRVGRTFWRAAALSMWPFVSVHLLLFFSMPWPIALASVLLAIAISFPLAHLFELAGGTIWAAALVHFVIQGTVKVLVLPQGAEAFALAWMAASAVIPLLALTIGRKPQAVESAR